MLKHVLKVFSILLNSPQSKHLILAWYWHCSLHTKNEMSGVSKLLVVHFTNGQAILIRNECFRRTPTALSLIIVK